MRDLALPQFWPKLTQIWPSWPLGQCLTMVKLRNWSENFNEIGGTLSSILSWTQINTLSTYVIANVICKIQGFVFLQNFQSLHFKWCVLHFHHLQSYKKTHLIQLKYAIHATYCLLTDYVGSFAEKETTEIHDNFIKSIIFHFEQLLHVSSKKVLVTSLMK